MQIAAKPVTEQQRLQALRAYEILDTPAEQAFDDLSRVASYICDTPIALVTLIDSDRQWLKAKVGLDVNETTRDAAFCAHTILGREIFEVMDTAVDPRFHDNPLVVGSPNIRFYAGMPLVTSDDHALGSLCVIDRQPRQLTAMQRDALEALGRQVVAQFEAHRNFRRLQAVSEQKDELLRVASHDLKNPLQAILASAEFIGTLLETEEHDREEVREFTALIAKRARNMKQLIEELVDRGAMEDGTLQLQPERVDLAALAHEVVVGLDAYAREKHIALEVAPGEGKMIVHADLARIRQVAENLVGNAIKFSPRSTTVRVHLALQDGMVSLTVTDEGPGLTEADLAKIFNKYVTLSARPTGGESSSGLGLFICRELVQAHGGRMLARNAPGRGAAFTMALPHVVESATGHAA